MIPMPFVMSSERLLDSMLAATSMKSSSDESSAELSPVASRMTFTLLASTCAPESALSIAAGSFWGKRPTTKPCDTGGTSLGTRLVDERSDSVAETYDAGRNHLFRRVGKVQPHAVVHVPPGVEAHAGNEDHVALGRDAQQVRRVDSRQRHPKEHPAGGERTMQPFEA